MSAEKFMEYGGSGDVCYRDRKPDKYYGDYEDYLWEKHEFDAPEPESRCGWHPREVWHIRGYFRCKNVKMTAPESDYCKEHTCKISGCIKPVLALTYSGHWTGKWVSKRCHEHSKRKD